MATPPEEICRQHDEACSLLDIMPSMERLDNGEIPLTQKQCPTCLFDDDDDDEKKQDFSMSDIICISSRGQVDVSQLQALVYEGYDDPKKDYSEEEELVNENQAGTTSTSKSRKYSPKFRDDFSPSNLWDDSNVIANNVWVTRPSHDAWGIKKIVLIFCDDFLRDVFELPWWHARPDIRQAIQPIIETLKIKPDRIVRMLLAALPPGVTIPIHHDTGEWVRKTHRVHVPVILTDPTKVIFRCGPGPDALSRIDCTPGHVFEMNNQAKHAVSNCGNDHRVHLILDFVDNDFIIRRRLQLEPGERLLQTRRSIDRLSERGTRPTPSFLILGAQKAGTTSLYEFIIQHPLAVRARRRETHCLDWRWNDKAKTTKARREHCLKFFHAKELEFHPSCLTGDSTPSYLLDSRRVIPRLKLVFPHPLKFFVMVRDPVARAFSHYQMVTSTEGTPEQIQTRGTEWRGLAFEQVIRQEMVKMQECGLIPYFNIETGQIDTTMFQSFAGSKAENDAWDRFLVDIPMNTGSHSLIARGLYELQLRPWFKFFEQDRFMIIRLEEMNGQGVSRIMDQVWDHLDLPRYQFEDVAAKNTRTYDRMSVETEQYLQRFYSPHNEKFATVVGVSGWKYAE